ncbi:polysaccharide deacetylase family protein [Candidatus Thiodiazotropha sp. LNASS1]|uniref:polysaccharide deacetylase family protein n=1 Tax=Candidatus Thiodiazotropha sp. LNASS1 TaxID=3096260 RepID=UPI00347C5E4F
MTRPEDRFEFTAMPHRPKWQLPEGKRVAVYTVVNVEEWDIEKPIAREYVTPPAGVVTVPNIPNWAWHEYGMRVGIWRLMEALGKRNLMASAAINARVCEGSGEPVARALCDAGWALMGHGYSQAALHIVPDQYEVIAKSFKLLRDFSGKAPKGWLGPGLHEKLDSLDILSEVGFKFVCDFPMDEQPVAMHTSSGPIVAMPYTLELSDLPMMVVHQHQSRVWLDRVIDQFDRLYAEGAEQPRVMSMSVHPYIMGVPHRIKYFEAGYDYMKKHSDVWFTTAEEIYDWFMSNPQ